MVNKFLKKYWEIVQYPVYIIVGWSALAAIFLMAAPKIYETVFGGISSTILIALVFGFIGFTTLIDHKQGLGGSAMAGLIAGVAVGVASGVLTLISVLVSPEILESSIEQAVAQGASRGQVEPIIKIMTYIAPITSAISNAIIGVVLAFLGGLVALIVKAIKTLITKKKKKK